MKSVIDTPAPANPALRWYGGKFRLGRWCAVAQEARAEELIYIKP